jgi:transposase
MNSFSQTDIFTMALGLHKPWTVTSVEMVPSQRHPERMEVHITVDWGEGSKFPCPTCEQECGVYDSKDKVWRHLNFFQYRCYIHARVPRIECKDHKVKLVDVPWARQGSGFTLLMEAVLLTMVQQMPVSQVAKQVGEQDTRLWRLIRWYVDEALEKQDFSGVEAIGVDEYSHRGHHYITVFLAHPEKKGGKARVLFTTEGKDKQTVTEFVETFKAKHGQEDKVRHITCDMCHGYRNAMAQSFPEAQTTVDKFHVVRMVNDGVDQVRRREMRSKDRKKIRSLVKTRHLWLKNPEKLNEDQLKHLDVLLNTEYLDTVVAYNFRLQLQDVYGRSLDYESAVESFENLCLQMSNSPIREVQKIAKSLTRNAVDILNYFDSKRTNALLEGFNSMIGLIKYRARGFRNMKNFMAMIYLVCGELQLPKATIM